MGSSPRTADTAGTQTATPQAFFVASRFYDGTRGHRSLHACVPVCLSARVRDVLVVSLLAAPP